ncbi:MAG TPA: hypothetical protein VEB65_00615, partial [Solirubrobacterales bacterium]|nr:hypothetical protein [Solirubrobacterales bacterium]
ASAGREALVSVTAEKGPARVQYLLFGFLGAGASLNVRLPSVGRIAVKFDPTKVTRKRRPEDCKSHPSIVASGYFRGSIELHGERGYTTVSRKSARGRLVRSFRGPCGKLGSGSTRQASREDAEEKKEGTTLGAAQRHGSLSFAAGVTGSEARSPAALVIASKTRFREGMRITSGVFVERDSDGFIELGTADPKAVDLEPPAPFKGSATFRRTAPKTSTWRGDLAVELPGIGNTRLAGKSFESTLCEGSRCTDTASESVKLTAKLFASLVGLFGALPSEPGASG